MGQVTINVSRFSPVGSNMSVAPLAAGPERLRSKAMIMSEYGIVLCFDDATEAKLMKLQSCFHLPEGLYVRPHITLATASSELVSELINSLRDCVRDFGCIEVEFSSVGMRPAEDNDVFLGLDNSPVLRNLHLNIIASLGPRFGEFQPYHLPNKWNPHCTIAYSVKDSDLSRSVQLCRKSDIFGKASLDEVVVVGARAEELSVFKLNKSS